MTYGIYLGSSGYMNIANVRVELKCDRCGLSSEDQPEVKFEMLPTLKAFMYGLPKTPGERIFLSICERCFTESDKRTLQRWDDEYDLRQRVLSRPSTPTANTPEATSGQVGSGCPP